MPSLGPRIVVAGTHSGVGKTTVATGLMAALAHRGTRVASAKVGPDFIDPGYHAIATGRSARTLDAWLMGEELLSPMAADASAGADMLVVEGVMGMFDGSGQPGCDGSTAAVAAAIGAPVVLVVDASAMSGSVAALVQGFRDFDHRVTIAGVILNRVGSPGHAELLREALDPLGVPVLGVILHDDRLAWRERHLGLVPVAEHPAEVARSIDRVRQAIEGSCDVERLAEVARSAAPRDARPPPGARHVADVRVALATGAPFSFVYPENLELLRQAGAELVPFDPLHDPVLPDACHALYMGGGFPEVYAAELAANTRLAGDVRTRIAGGMAVWAECGGLLWLCRSLDGAPMVGAIDADARMTDRLTIGYRSATTKLRSPFGPPGTALRGHEFHRTTTEPAGDALLLEARGRSAGAGYCSPTLFASYLHQLLAGRPELAERFVSAASAATAGATTAATAGATTGRGHEPGPGT